MVLEQTVVASTRLRNLVLTPQNPTSDLRVPSLIMIRYRCLLREQYLKGKRNIGCRLNQKVKCSSNNSKHANYYPKPSEVPWKKELCNSIDLIGIVVAPVQIKHLPSGKPLAWTTLSLNKTYSTKTSPISLTFWDELAHVAFQHVEKGQEIYVSGRLLKNTVESAKGKHQTYYKVLVQKLNFIDRSLSSTDHESDSLMAGRKGSTYTAINNACSIEQLWHSYFASPEEWWDYRKNKRRPEYPDFEHKYTGEALWIKDKFNPPWVRSNF